MTEREGEKEAAKLPKLLPQLSRTTKFNLAHETRTLSSLSTYQCKLLINLDKLLQLTRRGAHERPEANNRKIHTTTTKRETGQRLTWRKVQMYGRVRRPSRISRHVGPVPLQREIKLNQVSFANKTKSRCKLTRKDRSDPRRLPHRDLRKSRSRRRQTSISVPRLVLPSCQGEENAKVSL